MTPDPASVLAPAYAAYPNARVAIDVCVAAIRVAYPPDPPAIRAVRLHDPATGAALLDLLPTQPLVASQTNVTLHLSDLPEGTTIVAEPDVTPATIVFTFDGVDVRTEQTAPHCISGDAGVGRYEPWAGLTPGVHELTITPFDKPRGRAGTPARFRLTVVAKPIVGRAPDPGFSELPLAGGAKEFFVRADGADGNAGDAPDKPLRTIGRAMALLRDRAKTHPNAGDRLRLFAGHTFDEPVGVWPSSGVPGRPAGVFAFGDADARPVIRVRKDHGVVLDTAGLHDVAFVGVHFTAPDRDPKSATFNAASPAWSGIESRRAVTNLLIEDCRFDFFRYDLNLVVTADGARETGKSRHARVVVRRCLFLDAWAPSADAFKGQGFYAENITDLLIEECVFDHNGHLDGAPGGVAAKLTQYRHGLYSSAVHMGPVTFAGNLVSRNANCGAQVRSGGVVADNVFFDNGVSALLTGESAAFERNLVASGHDTSEHGLRIAVSLGSRVGVVRQNVLIGEGCRGGPYPAARINIDRRDWTGDGARSVEIAGNTLLGCDGPALRVGDSLDLLALRDNRLLGVAGPIVAMDQPVKRYQSTGVACSCAAGTPTFIHHSRGRQTPISLAAWRELTGDSMVVAAATPTSSSSSHPDGGWRFPPDLIEKHRARGRGRWDATSAPALVARAAREGAS